MGLVTVYCPFRRYDFSYLGVAHGPAEIVGRAERGDFMPPVTSLRWAVCAPWTLKDE